MCTVTLFPISDATGGRCDGPGLRLACNRDELRSRPAGLPPESQNFGRRQAILPIDPASGGTWIAANDRGLVMTVLNVNDVAQPSSAGFTGRQNTPSGATVPPSAPASGVWEPAASPAIRSRGLIIPSLLHCSDLGAATVIASRIDGSAYAPFRLVISDGRVVVEIVGLGLPRVTTRIQRVDGPLLFTSSGLGDSVVADYRGAVFGRLLEPGGDMRQLQDSFHRQRDPDRPHLSVCMSRPEARTVSHTVVEIGCGEAVMVYRPDSPDRPAPAFRLSLRLKAPARSTIGAFQPAVAAESASARRTSIEDSP